jgi:hypothetical protein
MNVTIARFAVLVLLLATGTAFAQAGPYDYWVVLSPGGSSTDASGTTEKVKVVVGNAGAPGSNAGPNYDVILTVKQGDREVCATGYSTLPPIQKGQQLTPLEFRLFFPKHSPKPGDLKLRVLLASYTLIANINTQYPNDDTNAANGRQIKTFAFKSGGQPTCQKLLQGQ